VLVYLYTNIPLRGLHAPLWVVNWTIAVGAAAILVSTLASTRVSAALQRPVLSWLGRVSFSLYLFHPLVIIAMMHTLHGRLSIWAIAALSLPVILLVAELGYRFIEVPTMRWGRSLSAQLHPRSPGVESRQAA
jgi:peptidoglycan/LPS O-acetylase OafA/YrhL